MNTPSTRPRLHGKRPGRRGLAAVWLVACAAAAVLIVLLWISLGFLRPSQAGKADRPAARRVMVLGIDAMDYSLTRRLMAEGRLPHFASLAEEGSFGPLETSMPPLSPVAWTTFATGTNPGGHGVFDFLRCDPARLGEGFPCDDAASEVVTDPVARPRAVPLTDYVLPAESHRRLRRRAPAFWDLLTDAGVKAVIYKIPANFPATARKARTLSGMGTVDVAGTYGAFLFLSDRPIDWARRTTGGRIVKARLQDGVVEAMDQHGKWARPMLYGPANPFLPEEADSADRLVTVPFDVFVDCEAHTAAIVLSDDELVLREGEWSRWCEVDFPLLPGLKQMHGLVRFYLKEAGEGFTLFVSPVNLAPGSEGLATGGLDMELYDSLGPYYTKGMPEQTKAVTDGLFTPAEYLKQSDLVLQERVAALEYLLDEFREGFLFFYISTLDLDSHVLWHHQEPDHPAYDPSVSPRFADAICRRYERMDKILARVRGSLGPDDVLYVMSDHGFASLRREFNAISWLAQKGYLTYKSAVAKRVSRFYGGVDWSGTLAYGVGFNGLRVNRKGREATGIVEEEQYDQLVVELRDKLLALRDIDGKRVFSNVYRRDEIYTGPCVADGPDLVLGYNRGFGPSDGSVLGHWSEDVLADRVRGFTGHHAMDYKRVPGVLFCSRRLEAVSARLQDVTVSVLRDFGVAPAAEMTGKPLRFRRIVKKGG